MFRQFARIAVTLAILAALGTASVGAQQMPSSQADLVRRIDSLLAAVPDTPEYEASADSAKLARAAEWERRNGVRDVELVTLRVGPMTVTAPSDQIDEAADRYRRAWNRYDPYVTNASGLLEGMTFGFQISTRGFVLGNSQVQQAVRVGPWTTEVGRELRTAAAIAAVLGRRMPPRLLEWAGAMPPLGDRPGRRPTFRWPDFYTRAYRDLAIQPARSAASCYAGEIASCLMALGLDEDVTWEDVYTPQEIRVVVTRSVRGYSQSDRDAVEACVVEGRYDVCAAFLTEQRPDALIPFSSWVRISLLHYALEIGGEGAFSRLISGDRESISDRLEDASRMEIDNLVEAWRTRVIEARPRIMARLPLTVLGALFWIGLMSVFGFRSTRWRIG